MLMISRKKNESFVIQIGDELITVTLTDVNGAGNKSQVQLGVDAPKKYKVWRSEIFDAMKENEQAVLEPVKPDKLRGLLKKP